MAFRFADVGTVAGAARKLVDDAGRKVKRDLILDIEQGAESDRSFGDHSDSALWKVLFE